MSETTENDAAAGDPRESAEDSAIPDSSGNQSSISSEKVEVIAKLIVEASRRRELVISPEGILKAWWISSGPLCLLLKNLSTPETRMRALVWLLSEGYFRQDDDGSIWFTKKRFQVGLTENPA